VNEKHERALEIDFPIQQLSELAQQESWRKEVNRPIYHIHKWWATRLGSIFRGLTLGALSDSNVDIWQSFYKQHNLSDKIVLDPFMGSGTTLGEALKLGARAVGCDINPVSTFAVRQAFTRVDEACLRQAFDRLESSIACEIRRYYQTRDRETGETIPVLYFFWCKTVRTPDGEEIPLFSRYVFAQDAYPKKKPRAQIVCPSCGSIVEDRYDATALKCPSCRHRFNPQDGPAKGQYVTSMKGSRHRIKDLLPLNGGPPRHRMYAMLAVRSNGEKVYLAPDAEDHALYAEAERRLATEKLPLPTLSVRPGHNTNQARGYNYKHWRQFFNDRQLLCLGLLLCEILRIEDVRIQEQMLCLFSSTLEFNNLFCSYKGEGTGAVRHMFSHHILKPERTPIENSVWGMSKSSGTFSTLFETRLLRAKKYLEAPFELEIERGLLGTRVGTRKTVASPPLDPRLVTHWNDLAKAPQGALILNGDSANLPIPDEAVDAVVTDPPYFDFVHYSELSDFFYAWLAPALSSRYPWMARRDSSDPGEVQHKDARTFSRQLTKVFAECHRVLKPDGILAFTFHHSRPEGWAAIYDAIETAGLAVVAAHPVHAELRGSSPKAAAKEPISLDAILVCKKRSVVRRRTEQVPAIDRADAIEAELTGCELTLSLNDRFVIAASQELINAAHEVLSFDDMAERLASLKTELFKMTSDVVSNAARHVSAGAAK